MLDRVDRVRFAQEATACRFDCAQFWVQNFDGDTLAITMGGRVNRAKSARTDDFIEAPLVSQHTTDAIVRELRGHAGGGTAHHRGPYQTWRKG